MATVGALVEGTIQMIASESTETIFGRVTEVSGGTVVVEGMITVRQDPGQLPVVVEIPATMRIPVANVTEL